MSFAPLKSTADLNLLDFLGVELPEKAMNYILESGNALDASRRSIINSLRIYGEIVSEIEQRNIPVPIGVNVEQLTKSNFQSSISMLDNFEKVIDLSCSEIMEYVSRMKGK
jgi:hypothetical protein